jgi:hypothetical protein
LGSRFLTIFPGAALLVFALLGALLFHAGRSRIINAFVEASCADGVAQSMFLFMEQYSLNSKGEVCVENSLCCDHPALALWEAQMLTRRQQRKLEVACATERALMGEARLAELNLLFKRLFGASAARARTFAVHYSLEPSAVQLEAISSALPHSCSPRFDLSGLSADQQIQLGAEYGKLESEMAERFMKAVP